MSRQITRIVLALLVVTVAASNSIATITVTGTDAEKKAINDAIKRIKDGSAEGKKCFEALEAAAQDVKVNFGATTDIATANGTTYEVKLFQEAIECLKQIDNNAGGGKALEASSLDLIIVHEVLGHLHNKIKGGKWGEPEAMAKTNKVRAELNLPKRTGYAKKEGDKIVAPFDDGSKLDGTEALKKKKASKTTGKDKKYIGFQQQANLNIVAENDPTSNTFFATLNELAGPQSMTLDFTAEGDGSIQVVDVLDFQLSFTESGIADFPVEILDFTMIFDSFDYFGVPTGVNTISLINEKRGGVGLLDLPSLGQDFNAIFEGDYLLNNPLWDAEGFDGLAVENMFADFFINLATQGHSGSLFLDGLGFAPIPEPTALAILIGIGILSLNVSHRLTRASQADEVTRGYV